MKPVQVEIFTSPGCTRCSRVLAVLQGIVTDLGEDQIQWRKVNVLDELDHAVELGVLSMPTIAIDGELVFTVHPSPEKFRAALQEHLNRRVSWPGAAPQPPGIVSRCRHHGTGKAQSVVVPDMAC